MNIKIKGREQELKFSFASFKHMKDFDIKEMDEIESKPFRVVGICEILLLGALNHNPKIKFSAEDVDVFLEEYVVENSIGDLLTELMELLQESNFFKSLQKNQTPAPVKPE